MLNYADDLENPPLLIVSGMETFKVHTHFTNSVQQVHIFSLDDLLEPQTRTLLKAAFINPEALTADGQRSVCYFA